MTRSAFRWLALLVGALAFSALRALGQMSMDPRPSQRTLSAAEQVEQEMATARFRLGPVRLLPFFTLSNVGWTNNALVTSEGTVDDYTASVAGGAKLILPVGRKLFLRGTVAPSYDWYYRTEQLRSFGGNYSGEAQGLFNRVTLAAGGGYSQRISSVTSEVARDVLNTSTTGFVQGELEILRRLSLFGGVLQITTRTADQAPATPGLSPVSDLDRTDTGARVGVRYAFSSAFSFGVMGDEVRTRFVKNSANPDFDTKGARFTARYDRERFYVDATVGVQEGKPVTPTDTFPEFRTGTYGYFVSYFLTKPVELQVLGSRRPVVSLFLDNPYYFETVNGARLSLAVGRRLSFYVGGQLGSNRYANPVLVVATGEIVVRRDDTSSYGGGFAVKVSRAMSIGLSAARDRWDSNIDYYDRETLRVTGGLNISADFGREARR